MKLLGRDLDDDEHDQHRKKDRAPDQVAQIDHDIGFEPRHRDAVAASLTKGRGKDFDDPEAEGDLWHFTVTLRAARHATSHDNQSGCRPAFTFCKTLPVVAFTLTSYVTLRLLTSQE